MTTRRQFVLGAASGMASLGFFSCAGTQRGGEGTPLPDVSPDLPPLPAPEERTEPGGAFEQLRGFCDDIEAVDVAEFGERRAKGEKLVSDARASALVLEAGVDMRYFTGVRWGTSERPLLFVLPSHGKPLFLGPAFERTRLEESVPKETELATWQEHENPYELLVELLRKRGTDSRRVVVGGNMRRVVADGLARATKVASLRSGQPVVDQARIIKTTRELARLRRINEATKAAIDAARPLVEPGMSEDEVALLFVEAQRAAGLDEIWILALVGPNAAFPHGTEQRRIVQEGDVVLVDTGGAVHGYRSDITRSFAVGRPGDEVQRAYDTVLAAQTAALSWIRPGEPCERADRAAREVMDAAGFGAGYERFTHRLGHGIGLEVHEPPYLVRGNRLALQAGMTMSNEPGIYVPGQFGIRIEDIVAVGSEQAEVFGPRAGPLGSA